MTLFTFSVSQLTVRADFVLYTLQSFRFFNFYSLTRAVLFSRSTKNLVPVPDMSADIILSGAQLALAPASWKYGALVIGVILTQIMGFLWYSPVLFGNIWLDYQPELKNKLASGNVDLKSKILTSTMGDLVLAVFLSIFFHPDSLTSVMVMWAFLVALNLLLQFPNIVWLDQKVGLVLINHGFDAMSVLIKLLALAYIPF